MALYGEEILVFGDEAIKDIDNDIIIQGDGCITSLAELYTVLVEPETTEIERFASQS